MLEEAQGADVQGRSIMVDYVGDKSQKGPTTPGKLLTFCKAMLRALVYTVQYFYKILSL